MDFLQNLLFRFGTSCSHAIILFGPAIILFGPAIPFIPQYLENQKTRNTEGISLFVSFLIVLSSCMKIAYWCGRPYDPYLFAQNFVTVFAVFIMLDQHIQMEMMRTFTRPEARNFVDFDLTWFWHWTNIMSYVQASGYIGIMLVLFATFFSWTTCVFETLAVLSMLIDSTKTLPQLVQNYLRKSTFGLNKAMVCLWIFWDAFSILYMTAYIYRTPLLFEVTVGVQMLVDIAIFLQIYYFGDHPSSMTSTITL